MKVIVTGANGFLGTALVKKMLDNNNDVLAIDICFTNPFFDNKRIKKLSMDLTNVDDLKNIVNFGEYEIFYNLAWKGVNGPEKARFDIQLNNIFISLKCAELAKSIGCKKFLCAGTIAERAIDSLSNLEKVSPGLMYSTAKYCNHIFLEEYCKTIGLDFVWMQFSNVYGPGNTTGNLISYTLTQLKQKLPAEFGPAEQPYDFLFVDDLIEAIYRLGIKKTNYNSYFIGSGKPQILKDYLFKIGEILGTPNLIRIGVREDDKIKYDYSMFDISKIKNDIGNYTSGTFEELIKYTIEKNKR